MKSILLLSGLLLSGSKNMLIYAYVIPMRLANTGLHTKIFVEDIK